MISKRNLKFYNYTYIIFPSHYKFQEFYCFYRIKKRIISSLIIFTNICFLSQFFSKAIQIYISIFFLNFQRNKIIRTYRNFAQSNYEFGETFLHLQTSLNLFFETHISYTTIVIKSTTTLIYSSRVFINDQTS